MDELYSEALARFHEVFARARTIGLREPNQVNLATVAADGRPSSRVVLLKGADERGFVFYTNLDSRKGKQLGQCKYAALCFYWEAIYEQIRVEGEVTFVSSEEADAYFATRDRMSQLGAWASQQSHPLASRAALESQLKAVERRFESSDVPRPSNWTGYRVVPSYFEFWKGREFRLHERTVYQDTAQGWIKGMLNP